MKRIAQLRKEKHLNQTGLGMKLNISQKMISAYENGTHQPSIATLKQMSDFFGASVDYIIENTDIKLKAEDLSQSGIDETCLKAFDIFKRLDRQKQQQAIGILFALENID